MNALDQQQLVPGLIGMAWPANAEYLRILHQSLGPSTTDNRCLNRIRTVMYEGNFELLVRHLVEGDWQRASQQITEAAVALKAAGADFLVITSNTGSSLASEAISQTGLPALSIVDVTITEITRLGFRRAGLLSTVRTSEARGYHVAGQQKGIEIIAPGTDIAKRVEQLIFNEMIYGEVSSAGCQLMLDAITWFADQGADCVILGCTDFVHMVPKLKGAALPIIDTTTVHARAAAKAAISGRLDSEMI